MSEEKNFINEAIPEDDFMNAPRDDSEFGANKELEIEVCDNFSKVALLSDLSNGWINKKVNIKTRIVGSSYTGTAFMLDARTNGGIYFVNADIRSFGFDKGCYIVGVNGANACNACNINIYSQDNYGVFLEGENVAGHRINIQYQSNSNGN